MNLPNSLHQMLRDTVAHTKKLQDTFLMQKIDGVWVSHSYGAILDRINGVSAYLVEHGFTKGDRLAMILENCPEFLIFDQALLQIGCVNASIYPTLPESEIEYIIKDSGSKGVLVGNPFLLKKVLKAAETCPDVKAIFLNFPRANAKSEDPRLVSLVDLFSQGDALYLKNKDGIEVLFESIGPKDLASLIYTSGTTGVPKGVMLSHENFMSNVWMAKTTVPSISKDDRYLSFLPLCHVYERLATYYLGIYVGAEIAFAQSIEALSANMAEVQPTVMTTVPRLLERVKERVIKSAETKGGLSKKIFYWAVGIGEAVRVKKEHGKWIDPLLAAKHKLATILVFKKVKARLGGKMRLLVSGGAALPQHVGEFFGNLGINALEGYGLTETSPLISINLEGKQVYGTVGAIVPNLQVGILDKDGSSFHTIQTSGSFDPDFSCEEGEIVVKGPSVMQGYWNKPEDTAAVIDKDGWFHTGDVGKFHHGYLKITDRIKNMLVNAYGKNIYPTPVENVYMKSSKIEQIFLIGDRREFITAIIVPAKEELKEKFGLNDAFFEETDPFIRNEEMILWMNEDIRKLSNELAKFERIKNFVLKRKPFSVEEGELTPTLKSKRRVIESKYAMEIEEMYEGVTEDL
ncbi:MAG TPA: long-chain fatty acid--CoA ligase [Bacteroidetes bacterium]|nr:long-chain fatty acid--CoA ligase [Bacteroidota bacterium]